MLLSTRFISTTGAFALTALLCAAAHAGTETLSLTPTKDNTLIETLDGSLSNGAGDGIYSGRTNFTAAGTLRRAVLAFDATGHVPPGARITCVTVSLVFLHSSSSGFQTHTLYRLLEDWGEGDSTHFGGHGAPAEPGDATWLHTFFSTDYWVTDGGAYAPKPSASALVGILTSEVTWGPTDALIADVQGWIDAPGTEFGWVLEGNEAELGTAKKFASRQWPDPALHPVLTIDYEMPCDADLDGDGTVDLADLTAVLSAWGPTAPCPPTAPEDLNADCSVGFTDLITVLAAWGPCPEP